jgi:opacity protein-like surface antigen
MGAAIGYSNMQLQGQGASSFPESGGFNAGAVGGSATIGVRLRPNAAGEISFIGFGTATSNNQLLSAPPSQTLHGVAAEGLVYFPATFANFFVKAGVASLFGTVHSPQQNSVTTYFNDESISEVAFAAGAGVQVKLGHQASDAWAARLQYDYFIGQWNSGFLSLGLTYFF